jgi:rubredoxin
MSVHGVHGMIDVYDIYLMNGAEYKTIYINMYGARNSTMAPSGFVLMAPAPKATAVKAPKQKEPKARKPKKPVNKKLVVYLTVIPVAVVILALLAVFVLVPGLKYNHAKKLLENGNYELAYSEFLALDGYSDSENMLLECRYVQAIKYRDAGDYELANKIFESLGNYRDSKILIHNHDYKVSNTIAATCTTAGSETYKCVNCEETYMKPINKIDHSYSVVSSIDATCNATGSKTYKCAGCDHTYSETVAKLTHKYEIVSSQEPTCQKEGYATHKCSLCSDEYTETKGKVSHDTILASTTDSTCTAVGAKNYKCKNCTYTYSEEISKKSHNYSAATCTAPKTCGMCGKTEGQKLGHSNTLICTRCGETTFEKLVLTGVGDKFYTDVDIPAGTYNVSITKTSIYHLYVEINDRIITSTDESLYITQVQINNGKNYSTGEYYGYDNAVLRIDTSQYATNEQWTVTIEAISN